MSSRLLNMKFMQRASASTSTTPTTPDGSRPSKRQRTEAAITPDALAFQEDAAAEEAKKNAFIERAAAEAGETKWVLSISDNKPSSTGPSLRIVEAGYGAIDSGVPMLESDEKEEDEEEQNAGMAGRRSFGRFNKTVERQHNPDLSSSESEHDSDEPSNSDFDSSSEEDEHEDVDPTAALLKAERKQAAAAKIRAERKAHRKAEEAKSKQMAERRRSKEVSLNKVGGISNAAVRGKQAAVANMACHECGKKGHLRIDCPDVKRKRQDKRKSMDY